MAEVLQIPQDLQLQSYVPVRRTTRPAHGTARIFDPGHVFDGLQPPDLSGMFLTAASKTRRTTLRAVPARRLNEIPHELCLDIPYFFILLYRVTRLMPRCLAVFVRLKLF